MRWMLESDMLCTLLGWSFLVSPQNCSEWKQDAKGPECAAFASLGNMNSARQPGELRGGLHVNSPQRLKKKATSVSKMTNAGTASNSCCVRLRNSLSASTTKTFRGEDMLSDSICCSHSSYLLMEYQPELENSRFPSDSIRNERSLLWHTKIQKDASLQKAVTTGSLKALEKKHPLRGKN